jgi:hypothetical protein
MTIVFTGSAGELDEDGYGAAHVTHRGQTHEQMADLYERAVQPNKAAIFAALKADGVKVAVLRFSGWWNDGTFDGATRDGKEVGQELGGAVTFRGGHGGHRDGEFARFRMSCRNAMDGLVMDALERYHGEGWQEGEHGSEGAATSDVASGRVTIELRWRGPGGARSATVI